MVPRPKETWWTRLSRVQRLGIIAVVAISVALAIGLGVGFGVGYKSREEAWEARHRPNSTSSPPLPTLPATPTGKSIWQPQLATQWQIVLQNSISIPADSTNTTPPDALIWDIDLFTNSKETITKLHSLGKKVICYFSAGSYEPDRPDSNQFQQSDMGKKLKGWPNERWLNTNSANIRKIMESRIKFAKSKGCDGIDPDNVDAYDNDNGLNLNSSDAVSYLAFLSQLAQANSLAIGLKNGADILGPVLPAMQFSVNEQCVEMEECERYAPFVQNGKPVFHIEYFNQVKGNARIVDSLCRDDGPAIGANNFSTVIKNDNLDGWVQYCNGASATTP